MDANIFYIGGNAIKMITSQSSLSASEIRRLLGKFGEIKQIISQNDFQIIYFNSVEDAQKCMKQFQCQVSTRGIKPDPASTGDRIAKNQLQECDETKKYQNMLTTEMDQADRLPRNSNSMKVSSPAEPQFKKVNQYIPNCSSPVLLNTMDPGIRLAYCHDVEDMKCVNMKPGRLNQFSKSIKKYMDETPKLCTHELVLTNLPANFEESDIYELCGRIEPEAIEVKRTSNINITYANIRAKTNDDFDKLVQILENCQINGMKITTIPVTKFENLSVRPFR